MSSQHLNSGAPSLMHVPMNPFSSSVEIMKSPSSSDGLLVMTTRLYAGALIASSIQSCDSVI